MAELSAVIADLRQDRDSWLEQAPTVGLARSETGAATRETPDVVVMAADRGVNVFRQTVTLRYHRVPTAILLRADEVIE